MQPLDTSLATPTSKPRRARTIGHASRLSLNFPIQCSDSRETWARISTPDSLTPNRVSLPASPVVNASSLTLGPGNFFTILAAQERRVLELREELHRAESDLERLKKQWSIREAGKKRTSFRHSDPLQPLNLGLARADSSSDDDMNSVRLSLERERRKLIQKVTPPPQRTVFSGGRHTRALSLLSPTLNVNGGTDFNAVSRDTNPSRQRSRIAASGRGDDSRVREYNIPTPTSDLSREAIFRTGRQMAVDLKAGLWTFIEDLRQATVGDEATSTTGARAINGSRPMMRQNARRNRIYDEGRTPTSTANRGRKKPIGTDHENLIQLSDDYGNGRSKSRGSTQFASKQSRSRPTSLLIDADGSFWQEFGVGETPTTTKEAVSGCAGEESSGLSSSTEDDWDNWDSPETNKSSKRQTSHCGESSRSRSSPNHTLNSSRTSTSSFTDKGRVCSKHDSIPWMASNKLPPSRLTSTVSNLKELEKCMIPSPEESEEFEKHGNGN